MNKIFRIISLFIVAFILSGCAALTEILTVRDIAGWWIDSSGKAIEIINIGPTTFSVSRSGSQKSILGEQAGAGIVKLPGATSRELVDPDGPPRFEYVGSSLNDGSKLTQINWGGGRIWKRCTDCETVSSAPTEADPLACVRSRPEFAIPKIQRCNAIEGLITKFNKLPYATPTLIQFDHQSSYANANSPEDHINGMAVLVDGSYVLSHSLTFGNGGWLLLADPDSGNFNFNEFTGFNYQSGLQGCGNILIAGTRAKDNSLKFYLKSGSTLKELAQSISGDTWENAALAYHAAFGRHYAVANGYLFESNGKALDDPEIEWLRIGQSSHRRGKEGSIALRPGYRNAATFNLPNGEGGGTSLLYEPANSTHPNGRLFYLVLQPSWRAVLYEILFPMMNSESESCSQLNTQKIDSITLKTPSKETYSVVDKIEDSRPQFRWAGSAAVTTSGELMVVASGRNIYLATFSKDFLRGTPSLYGGSWDGAAWFSEKTLPKYLWCGLDGCVANRSETDRVNRDKDKEDIPGCPTHYRHFSWEKDPQIWPVADVWSRKCRLSQ